MRVPKKISPDNLKDSIVQILFNPGVPPELFLGLFSNAFETKLNFITASQKSKPIKNSEGEGLAFESELRGYFLDETKRVKIDVSGSAIVFNSFAEYIGWEDYFPIISSTIQIMFSKNLIKDVKRIGIRYISQFDNINLIDNLNMSLSIDVPNKNLEATQIRTEYLENECRIILTLINKIKQLENVSLQVLNSSIVDIDVIQFPLNYASSDKVIEAINNGHDKQKITFFSLLKESFLEKLNPVY